MDFHSYEPEDFAADERFSNWVLYPDAESDSFWMDWIDYHPHKRRDIELARQIILIARDLPENGPSEETIQRIWAGISDRKIKQRSSSAWTRPLWRYWSVAASVGGVLILGFLGYMFFAKRDLTYQTAYGESARFKLPDGTLVTLNANSSLRVDEGWQKKGSRHVWLEGEAFFNVSKRVSNGKPVKFTVHTDDLNIEVKGTQFNVNTRSEQTKVVLSEGQIQLQLNNSQKIKTIPMKPGDWVDYSKESGALSLKHVEDTAPLYSWKDNRWTLEDTELKEVGKLIHETYGLSVRFQSDTIARIKVTGVIPSDNLGDLLSTLESILPVHINKSDKTITVEKEQERQEPE